MGKIKRAFFKGFGSSIDFSEAESIRPKHHVYGHEGIARDFKNVGNDICKSMGAISRDGVEASKSGRRF